LGGSDFAFDSIHGTAGNKNLLIDELVCRFWTYDVSIGTQTRQSEAVSGRFF
jgi:hypothetical protein